MKQVMKDFFMWLAIVLLFVGLIQVATEIPLEYEESDFQRNGE